MVMPDAIGAQVREFAWTTLAAQFDLMERLRALRVKKARRIEREAGHPGEHRIPAPSYAHDVYSVQARPQIARSKGALCL